MGIFRILKRHGDVMES